ncbi:F-box domain-containing protein [Artemisia annua]|uniref:F-box domain-containing protein n=1 Tax=Artemisia annua TaxID=35608 RepID=A0A2U1KGL3_ARTAN|nr:F-box domain-containing protein [Artemisia annua]
MSGPRAAPPKSLVALTHLVTFTAPMVTSKETTECEHLNGLILFNSGNGFVENDYAYVTNPSTRETVKISAPVSVLANIYGKVHICYFFGYDEVRNEHKVLNIRMLDIKSLKPFKPSRVEIMLYELSSFTWRKIDVDLPFDISGDRWCYGTKHSVCVNSVIYVMLQSRNEILAFDLRTEMFEIINLPSGAIHDIPQGSSKRVCKKGLNTVVSNQPFLMKVHGLLGVVCYDREAISSQMRIWLLKDYEKRVWVRESVGFSESWFLLDGPFLLNPYFMKNVPIPMYDMERRSLEPVQYASRDLFLHSENVRFDHVRSYVESIYPLRRNRSRTSRAG